MMKLSLICALVILFDVASGFQRLPISARIFRNTAVNRPLEATPVSIKNPPDASSPLFSEHPNITRGVLSNGLRYVILPHSSRTVEARLEILSGSVSETEGQLGTAHLLEHVVFMDNSHRQQLGLKGVQTNAYTDFHQTVYTASSLPTLSSPSSSQPLSRSSEDEAGSVMKLIFKSFRDVFTFGQGLCGPEGNETNSEAWEEVERRLRKEQAAILSEASMVNSAEYRHEAAVLASLHTENLISRRMPIGDAKQVQQCTPHDLLRFHREHYKPSNAILYLLGDLSRQGGTAGAEQMIQDVFSNLSGKVAPIEQSTAGESTASTNTSFSVRGRALMNHLWSGNSTTTGAILEQNQFPRARSPLGAWISTSVTSKQKKIVGGRLPPPVAVLKHDFPGNAVAVRVLAKQPIESINSLSRFRRGLLRKIVLKAIAVR